jgi:hypothetical protein
METIKKYLAPVGLFFLAIIAVLRYFKAPKATTNPFPGAEEKKKVEADIAETKKDIEELADKQYSDEEIKDKFNVD